MFIKVTQEHIDAARELHSSTGTYRSPLHFALNDAFESSPLKYNKGRKVLFMTYDQLSVEDAKVYTTKNGSGPYRGWLKKVQGQVETPQHYLLNWDFAGIAEPVEFVYIEPLPFFLVDLLMYCRKR